MLFYVNDWLFFDNPNKLLILFNYNKNLITWLITLLTFMPEVIALSYIYSSFFAPF